MKIINFLKTNKSDFANKVGVDLSTVYRWLKGDCSPTFDDLVAIKTVTNDDANELIDFFDDLKSKDTKKTKDKKIVYNRICL